MARRAKGPGDGHGHMELEMSLPGDSWLHHLDPRGKILIAFLFAAISAVVSRVDAALASMTLAALLLISTWASPWLLLRRLAGINIFVAFLWAFLPWELAFDGPQGIHIIYNPRGVQLAVLITIKVNAIFMAILALIGTSRVNDIFHALDHLHAPRKLVALLLFFHRYVHLILREQQRMKAAVRVRGFQPGTNWHTYRTYGFMIGMLLVRSYVRAQRVYDAMICRGFNGTIWLLDHMIWQRKDTVFCGISAVVCAALLCFWLSGGTGFCNW